MHVIFQWFFFIPLTVFTKETKMKYFIFFNLRKNQSRMLIQRIFSVYLYILPSSTILIILLRWRLINCKTKNIRDMITAV